MNSRQAYNSGLPIKTNSFLAWCKSIYCNVPPYLHFIFVPIEQLFWIVSVFKVGTWFIAGKERCTGENFSIVYAGLEENRCLLTNMIFESCTEVDCGKQWLWKIPETARNHPNPCSMIIREVPGRYEVVFRSKSSFFLPNWIQAGVDISGDMEAHIKQNRSLKSDVQRIKKNNLCYDVANNIDSLREFYDTMYLPYITQSYGNEASLLSYEHFEKQFKKCDLLFLKKENERIGGILINYSKRLPHLWVLGIKEAKIEYVNDGAIGALFFFAVSHVKAKGFKLANLGLTRAFLKNGALQFKKKRGMQILGTLKMGFLIQPLNMNEGVKSFFSHNPFIYLHKQRYYGAFFVAAEHCFTEEEFDQIYNDYFLRGISKIVIYTFGDVTAEMQKIVPNRYSDKIMLSPSGLKNEKI
jgi:elongation factor P hydroxylase